MNIFMGDGGSWRHDPDFNGAPEISTLRLVVEGTIALLVLTIVFGGLGYLAGHLIKLLWRSFT